MIKEKSWEEFRETGLLWWINTLLQIFGWSIACETDEDGKFITVFPARVKFRGFSEKENTKGYVKVSEYLKENISDLENEAKIKKLSKIYKMKG